MWTFRSASDAGAPLLTSLNGNKGRQTWEFDAGGGSEEQRARVEALRAAFTANRHEQRHSADELLRLQVADRTAAKRYSPPQQQQQQPGDQKGSGEQQIPAAETVEQHLLGAISFYECLQQEDGHFPGVLLCVIRPVLRWEQRINQRASGGFARCSCRR
jgi:cycloartenol synthase